MVIGIGQTGGVILAGGLSRRMGGGDKCLIPLAGKPILAHVIERLNPALDRLALNANGDPARFAAFGLPVLADSEPGHPGPLAGVLAGMDWAAAVGLSRIVTVAADTPFFPDTLVTRLLAGAGDAPLAVAVTEDPERGLSPHPTFGLWDPALREDLRAAIRAGTRRVVDWTRRHGVVSVPFTDAGIYPFFNVNRPEDLARAEALAAAWSP